jgi:hypothetical protein
MQDERREGHGFPPGRPFRDLSSEPAAEQEEPAVVGGGADGPEEQVQALPSVRIDALRVP